MTRVARFNTKLKATLLVVILLGTGIPALVLSESLKIPMPPGPVLKRDEGCTDFTDAARFFDGKNVTAPRFCQSEVDFLLGPYLRDAATYLEHLNNTLWSLSRTLEKQYDTKHPHYPANVFQDDFNGGRVGGFGDWRRITVDGDGDPWGVQRWRDNESIALTKGRGYPMGLDTFLVSPEVDLTTVIGKSDVLNRPRAVVTDALKNFPETLNFENPTGTIADPLLAERTRTAVGILQNAGIDPAVAAQVYKENIRDFKKTAMAMVERFEHQQLVILTFQAKYNFANNTDGFRLVAFLEPPTADNILTIPYVVLTPNGNPSDHPRSNHSYAEKVKAFGQSPAFTGSTDGWQQMAFDLSTLQGRSVWLGFQVKTDILLRPSDSYFKDRTRFDRTDFYGLALDDLRVNATQYPLNIRIKALVEPSLTYENVTAAAPGSETPVVLQVHNAGMYNESIIAKVKVVDAEGRATPVTPSEVILPNVPPGGVTTARFNWTVPSEEGARYTLTASVSYSNLSDPRFLDDATLVQAEAGEAARDNVLTLPIRAINVTRLDALRDPHGASLVTVSPPFADVGTSRVVALTVKNTGTTHARFQVTPFILQDPCATEGSCHFEEFIEGYLPSRGARIAELAPGETVTFTWVLRPYLKGAYDLEFRYEQIAPGTNEVLRDLGKTTGRLFVRDAPGISCLDNLGDLRTCGLGLSRLGLESALADVYTAPDGASFVVGPGIRYLIPVQGEPRNLTQGSLAAWRAVSGLGVANVWAVGSGGNLSHWNGLTWTDIRPGAPADVPLANGTHLAGLATPTTDDLLDVAVTAQGLYVATATQVYLLPADGGAWRALVGSIDPVLDSPIVALAVSPGSTDLVIVGHADGRVHMRVTSSGNPWTQTLAPGAPVRGLAATSDAALFVLRGPDTVTRILLDGPTPTTGAVTTQTVAGADLKAIAALTSRTAAAVGTGGKLYLFGGALLTLGASTPGGLDGFEGYLDGVRVSRVPRDIAGAMPGLDATSGSAWERNAELVPDADTVALYTFANTTVLAGGRRVADLSGASPLLLTGGARNESAGPSGPTLGALRIPAGGSAYALDRVGLDVGSRGTVELWVNATDPYRGGTLVSRAAPTGNSLDRHFTLRIAANGTPEFLLGGDGANVTHLVAHRPLTPGTWTHLGATWDGHWVRLYVDGVLTAAAPQAALAWRDLRDPATAPLPATTWRAVLLPSPLLALAAASFSESGVLTAVGGNDTVRTLPYVAQAPSEWVANGGTLPLTPKTAPKAWYGANPAGAPPAVLVADSLDLPRAQANLIQSLGRDTGVSNPAERATNAYRDVVLRIRHAPLGPVSLWLSPARAAELPSGGKDGAGTAENTTGEDVTGQPADTTWLTQRILLARWNGTGDGYEWRTDTLHLDRILREYGLTEQWFTTLTLQFQLDGGGRWAIDEVEVRGSFAYPESLRRDTLLHWTGAATSVGRWEPAIGGNATAPAGAATPYWTVVNAPLRGSTTSLWHLNASLRGENGAWVYNAHPGNRQYGRNEDARLLTPAVDLTGTQFPTLTFLHKHMFYSGLRTPSGGPVIDLYGLGTVEMQVLQADGTWGPYHVIQPNGGYPRATLPPGNRLNWSQGYWNSSDPALTALQNLPASEEPQKRFSAAMTSDAYWQEAVFNLSVQDVPGGIAGKTVRFSFRVQTLETTTFPRHFSDEGWYVTDVKVRGAEKAATDLAVTATSLATSYDAAKIGVGPGTTVTVRVEVTNRGLFEASNFLVALDERVHQGPDRLPRGTPLHTTYSAPVRVPLAPGASTVVEVPWHVPATPATRDYVLTATVVSLDPDGDLTNNARTVGTAAAPIRARAHPDLAVTVSVTPKAATSEIERRIDVTLVNAGNIPLTAVSLTRAIDRVTASGASDPVETGFRRDLVNPDLENGLMPGQSVSARRFEAATYTDADTRWRPQENARYVFTVTADLVGIPDADPSNNLARDLIDAYNVFYTDALDTLTEEELTRYRLDPGWRLSEAGALGRGQGFLFGDPVTGRVPPNADASLYLPVVDVSPASSAILTFSTNVSFESRYDGGVVEMRSFRNGAWTSWATLAPEAFPGSEHVVASLHPSNPVVPLFEPLGPVAFTHDSSKGLAAHLGQKDGWFTTSYNLALGPGMTETATFASFTLDALVNDAVAVEGNPYRVQRDVAADGDLVWRGLSWGEGLEGWEVHNLTYRDPKPMVGPTFWWSGSSILSDDGVSPVAETPSGDSGGSMHRIDHTFNLQDVPSTRKVIISMWIWYQDGLWLGNSTFNCGAGTTTPVCLRVFNPQDLAADAAKSATISPKPEDVKAQVGNWRYVEIELADQKIGVESFRYWNRDVTLRVEYGPQRQTRGIAIDGLTVTTYRQEADRRADEFVLYSESKGLPTPIITVAPRSIANHAGTAPEAGLGRSWTQTALVPSVTNPWKKAEEGNGDSKNVFWSTSDPAIAGDGYRASADSRLVTPAIDLSRVFGRTVNLTFREKHEFSGSVNAPTWGNGRVLNIQYLAHKGVFEVGVLNEATGEWGPWTPLRTFTGGTFDQWRTVDPIDVSEYKGKTVRFAFHVVGGPVNPTRGWAIDDLQFHGDVLAGAPVEVRLRAGTDGSSNQGAWKVDALQIVGTLYKNNLEVSLDTPTRLTLAPGSSFWVNGSLRNLGANFRDNVALVIEALSTDTAKDPSNPEVSLQRVTPEGGLLSGNQHRIVVGPFALTKGGNVSFSALVTAPARPFATESETFSYVVNVGARRVTATGVAPLTADEVTTNLDRAVTLTTQAIRHATLSLPEAFPSNVAPGETVTLTATVTNTGTLPTEASLACRVSRIRGWEPGDHSPGQNVSARELKGLTSPCEGGADGTSTLAPGATQTVTWTFTTPTSEGVYEVNLSGRYLRAPGVTAALQPRESLLKVGGSFEILGATFETETQQREWAPSGWRATEENRYRGAASYFSGVSAAQYESGGSYGRNMLNQLVSPLVDLRNFTGTDLYLSFWHLPRFAHGDGGVVEVRRLNNEAFPDQESAYGPWCRIMPDTWDGGKILSFNPYNGGPGDQDPRPADINRAYQVDPNGGFGEGAHGTPGLTGFKSTWQRAVFKLNGQLDPRVGDPHLAQFWGRQSAQMREACQEVQDYTGSVVQLRLVMGTGQADDRTAQVPDPIERGRGQGWYVDDIMISPYRGEIAPVEQSWAITDDATKVYSVLVRNDAAYTERFAVALDSLVTAVPPKWSVTVLTPTLTLRPGETGIAKVQVRTEIDRGRISPAVIPVGLVLQSLEEPNRVERARIDLLFNPQPWADLRVTLQAPGKTVQEGVPVTFTVTVQNTGLKDSDPTQLVFTDLTTGEVIQQVDIPAIPPFSRNREQSKIVIPLTWKPSVGSVGIHSLAAVVDPIEAFKEYSKEDNNASLSIEVSRLLRPDLVIRPENVEITSSVGDVGGDYREGDVVKIRVTVENHGTVGARDVTARVSVGPLRIPVKSVGLIPPGGNATATFTWLAKAGDWKVQVIAQVDEVEIDSDNNRVDVDVLVKAFNVRLSVDPPTLELAPGETRFLTYTVTNVGGAQESVRLAAEFPPGITVTGLTGEMLLPAGGVRVETLTVKAGPSALAGTTTPTLEVAAASGGARDRSVAAVDLTVRPAYALEVTASDATGRPGSLAFPVEVRNLGNSREAVTLSVIGMPANWTVDPKHLTLEVAPGERLTHRIPITAPADAAATTHALKVRATSGTATAESSLSLHVSEVVSLQVTPGAPAYDEEDGTYVLTATLRNVGNTNTTARLLALELPAGWSMTTSEERVDVPAGASRPLQVTLRPPAKASAGTYGVGLYAEVPGVQPLSPEGLEAQARVAVPVERPDFAVTDLETSPRFNLQEGDVVKVTATVHNRGLVTDRPVKVHLFVDDKFILQTEVPLVDGAGNATVTLAWVAKPGKHTVTVVVDPLSDLAESDEDNNAVATLVTVEAKTGLAETVSGAAQVPGPGMGLLALALLGVALLSGARRRRR